MRKAKNLMKTTQLENKVIEYMRNNVGDLDDWFFVDEMKISGIEKKQMSGIISSLSKKNIIETNGNEIALVENL